MEILQKIVVWFSGLPDWTFLALVPLLILAAAVAFVFLPKRRWFFPVAGMLAAVGFLTAFSKDRGLSVFYLACLFAFTALVSLLFLIPHLKKRGAKEPKKKAKTREEKIYEKFHEALSEQPYMPRAAMPQKVCCFEEAKDDGATAEEYGMSLSYADALLAKLRLKKLEAGDRLETEELCGRLDCYRNKPLTEDERNSLNDCLASVLKLTAKYRL